MTDRLNRAETERDLTAIVRLLLEIRPAWDHAVEGGAYAPRTESNGRGRGFTDLKPTESAVFNPTQRQLRSKARQAAKVIAHARADLEEAATILANGMLQTDPDEWIVARDKRQAALG